MIRADKAAAGGDGTRDGEGDPPALQSQKPMHPRHLAPPFDALLGALPEAAATVPAMMSLAEREFLFGAAKRYYTGAGIIVDAGTFLGASTMAFGLGLRENPRAGEILTNRARPIVSCELGITSDQMPATFRRHGVAEDLTAGDSFAPLLEANIAPVRDLVDLRLGDITELGRIADPMPRRKTPIEILFLDVLKMLHVSEFCLREYFSRLIPRRSLVIHQDYMAGELPFILVHQGLFEKKFEYVGEISSTAVFRLLHRITDEEIDALFDPGPDLETQLSLVAAGAQRSIDPFRRLLMSFATLRMVIRARGLDAGRRYWAAVELQHGRQIGRVHFRRVQNVVRACRHVCEHGLDGEEEAILICAGHRGLDHRRPGLRPEESAST